jgi:predicted O-linked N-acetylglucosamine transferase (SPINDLY family)
MAQRAWLLLCMERHEECLKDAEAALALKPDYAEGLNLKAAALCKLRRPELALSVVERAIALEPGYLDALCTQALTLIGIGDHDAAVLAYRRALAIDADCMPARAGIVAACIPAVPATREADVASRALLDGELSDFEKWLAIRTSSQRELLQLAQQELFYLSYQEADNGPWLARYRGAIAGRAASPRTMLRSAPQARRRIGIVSSHVFDHSVFVALTLGWLKHLDQSQFEITLLSLGKRKDAQTQTARTLVEHLESDRGGAAAWAARISDLDFDALIYPEVGMDPTTMSLAHLRLAPLQLAAWGHPETTGLATMDGFVSAQAYEPEAAQQHYGEVLWALPHLGVAYAPQPEPEVPLDLETLGLDLKVPLFVCAGTPFKYRPENDQVLAQIAQRVGVCQFLFFDYERRGLSRRLQERLARCFVDHGLDPRLYLKSLPWLPRGKFIALLRRSHVFLDTIGFSGFNTQMLALQAHTPSVAFEGKFMRGRLASGVLRHLGLPELVGGDRERYIHIASRLASDARYHAKIRGRLAEVEPQAYDDPEPVRALERVLTGQTRR